MSQDESDNGGGAREPDPSSGGHPRCVRWRDTIAYSDRRIRPYCDKCVAISNVVHPRSSIYGTDRASQSLSPGCVSYKTSVRVLSREDETNAALHDYIQREFESPVHGDNMRRRECAHDTPAPLRAHSIQDSDSRGSMRTALLNQDLLTQLIIHERILGKTSHNSPP